MGNRSRAVSAVVVASIGIVMTVATGPVTAQGEDAADNGEVVDFADRFTAPGSKSADPVILVADGSSCAPEVERTMGFVRRTQTNEVRLDRVHRVGYYALTPDDFGNFDLRNDDLTSFTKAVHKFGGEADLVVARRGFRGDIPPRDQDEQSGLALGKSFVLLNLVDQITHLVEKDNFDGVVIDFDDVLDPTTDGADISTSYVFFLGRLKRSLDDLAGDHQLSIILPGSSAQEANGDATPAEAAPEANGDATPAEVAAVDADDLVGIAEAVTRVLVIDDSLESVKDQIPNSIAEPETIEAKLMRIVQPMPPPDTDDDLRPQPFEPGGLAVWNLDQLETVESDIVAQTLIEQDPKNAVERAVEPHICPRRVTVRWATGGLGLVGVVGLAAWFAFYDLRRKRRFIPMKRGLLVPASIALAVAAALFASLVIADPLFEGSEVPVFIAAVLLLALIAGFQVWTSRNADRYP